VHEDLPHKLEQKFPQKSESATTTMPVTRRAKASSLMAATQSSRAKTARSPVSAKAEVAESQAKTLSRSGVTLAVEDAQVRHDTDPEPANVIAPSEAASVGGIDVDDSSTANKPSDTNEEYPAEVTPTASTSPTAIAKASSADAKSTPARIATVIADASAMKVGGPIASRVVPATGAVGASSPTVSATILPANVANAIDVSDIGVDAVVEAPAVANPVIAKPVAIDPGTSPAPKASATSITGSGIDDTIEVHVDTKPSPFIDSDVQATDALAAEALDATDGAFPSVADAIEAATLGSGTDRQTCGKPGFQPASKASLAMHIQAPAKCSTVTQSGIDSNAVEAATFVSGTDAVDRQTCGKPGLQLTPKALLSMHIQAPSTTNPSTVTPSGIDSNASSTVDFSANRAGLAFSGGGPGVHSLALESSSSPPLSVPFAVSPTLF